MLAPEPAVRANPRRRMRGADRRRLIQETAAELFSANGYARTTMQDIATAVGIKKGSLYYFYKSKDALLAELFHMALAIPQERFDDIVASECGNVEKLQQLVTVLVRAYDEHLPLMVTFTRIGLDSVEDPVRRAELKSMRRRFETTWEGAVRAGMNAGELRADLDDKLVAFGIIGMINWMYKWYAPGGRKSADDIAHTFNAMIRDGLAHDPQGRGAGMSGG